MTRKWCKDTVCESFEMKNYQISEPKISYREYLKIHTVQWPVCAMTWTLVLHVFAKDRQFLSSTTTLDVKIVSKCIPVFPSSSYSSF